MTAGSGGPAPNRVCDAARIDIPIIQAPMTYIAGAQLAAAVSNAGALGINETTSDQGRADLQRVRDLTDGAVGANIALIMNRDPAVVDLLVANDIGFVTTSAGDPSLFTGRLHDAGITVFHVVGTLASAKKAPLVQNHRETPQSARPGRSDQRTVLPSDVAGQQLDGLPARGV